MDDFLYHHHMIYDLPEDYHEPHDDYPPRKTKTKPIYFDLSKPYQEERVCNMNTYRVQGINKSVKPPCKYSATIKANDSTEATQYALMEMGWQGKITSCKLLN